MKLKSVNKLFTLTVYYKLLKYLLTKRRLTTSLCFVNENI
jgi:hypothetical protein